MRKQQNRALHAVVAGLCTACLHQAASEARETPYGEEPAAVLCEGNGLIWDQQLAALLNGGTGRRITVLDSCHSGGFVNDLAGRSLSYVAAACDWDELSYGTFGQTFMNESISHTLHESFVTAAAAVLDTQLPQEGGDLGGASLNFLAGDRAVVFSAKDPAIAAFAQDVQVTRDALLGHSGLPWPAASIASYYGDGTGEPWYTGAATRANLVAAINTALTGLPDTGNLFLYLDDHGASTDVIKSRVDGRNYEYETTVSLWRGWTDDNPYGIWKVRHKLVDADPTHYLNIHFDLTDWVGEVVGEWMEYYSTRPEDRSTWLVAGMDYDFGYTYYTDPATVHVDWESISRRGGLDYVNDWGHVDLAADGTEIGNLGRGAYVWLENETAAVDPMLWSGWMNGGDGWVLAPMAVPVPGPASGGFLLGSCVVGARLIRRFRQRRDR